jgi:prephenate dehydrogenase
MITALEQERLNYINSLMQRLHSLNVIIYESLCDREYQNTQEAIAEIQEELKQLTDSIQDDL